MSAGNATCVERLFILPLGDIDTAYEEMLPGKADGTRYVFPVTAALLDLGDRGWMLVDTGMDDEHATTPGLVWGATPLARQIIPRLPGDQTLQHRLRQIGVGVDQVTHVVNTHLHFDHAGNNHLFSHADVHVRIEQLQDARRNPESYPLAYRVDSPQTKPIFGDGEIVPGVNLFASPGHVPGHQSVLVKLRASSDMLLCGDAIPNREFVDDENYAAARDPATASATAESLLARARRSGAIPVFPHDHRTISTLRTIPNYYQ